ncbi:uncharacterized protein LOC122665574 [Telopea speciosissima]|uniref:uncharacterized protein LOC122665574 n=1 Tax=Telopea speciosissima TaxID=54955 RepID=UPI001CC47247|nr:uncharacterized protein LOC122665574 [Telopea speciosissima]
MFPRADSLCWGAEKHGIFFVKSVYHLLSNLRDQQVQLRASSSRSHSWEEIPPSVWKRIWGCKTLPKIKSFLWKCCAQGVPTRDNLTKRQIHVDPGCIRCGGSAETIDHLLLDCPFARATWFGSNLSFIVPSHTSPKLSHILRIWKEYNFPSKKDEEETLALFFFVCWYLWLARNELVFHQNAQEAQDVFLRAHRAFAEF